MLTWVHVDVSADCINNGECYDVGRNHLTQSGYFSISIFSSKILDAVGRKEISVWRIHFKVCEIEVDIMHSSKLDVALIGAINVNTKALFELGSNG